MGKKPMKSLDTLSKKTNGTKLNFKQERDSQLQEVLTLPLSMKEECTSLEGKMMTTTNTTTSGG